MEINQEENKIETPIEVPTVQDTQNVPIVENITNKQVYKKKLGGRGGKGFMPGVSGNPAGKPKGARHFSTLIREAIIKVAEGDAEPTDILIVQQLVTKAKKGDLAAIDRVIDRVDGKAEQTINLDADIHTDYQFSKEEQDALLDLLK